MKKTIFIALMLILAATASTIAHSQTPQTKNAVTPTPLGEGVSEEPSPEGVALASAEPIAVQATPQVAPNVAQVQQEAASISLFLDNADIHQIIRIIGEELDLNYIVDPAVQGTVNINTAGNLQRSDLLPILETILRINGATIVQTGNFYEIVPSAFAIRQALPVQDARFPVTVDDQFVIQVVRMKFVSSEAMSQLLTPYLSDGANIVVHAAGNIMLVSERRGNLRKLLEIVDVFDTNIFEGERVRLFPIENNLAADIVEDLDTIFTGYALSDTGGAIGFVAIERMNSILVVSPNPSVFQEVEGWLARLDLPSQAVGIRNFVYRMKNAKAADIQNVLMQLYGTTVQVSSIYQTAAATASSSDGRTMPGAGNDNAPGTAFVPSGNVKIIADMINNALVIQATPQEYSVIEATIEQLDVLPRQVLIDAQIYEVTLDDSIAFGLSAILQNRGTLNPAQTTASFVGDPASLRATTFAFIGRARELIAFLSASENRGRVRAVSAPSVMVSDNKTAQFTVGAEVPVPTSSAASAAQIDGSSLFAQTIQFRETGVIMNVTPQINESGNLTLEIRQEVSQASQNTTSGLVAPLIGKSSVESTVVIQDGQTIALGGFIRETNNETRSRIPILGRIPGLGVLFGSTSRTNTRSELVILITPHVIRTHADADSATEELKSKLKEIGKMRQ